MTAALMTSKAWAVARDKFFKKIHQIFGESIFAAERQFERLTLMQKIAVAKAVGVEFKPHLRDYDPEDRLKIGESIRIMKSVASVFVIPVTVKDFLRIDSTVVMYEAEYKVIYEDSNIKSE
ncbi:hypothetical protein QV08_09635 [Gallibacterium salpingitidis]|uniref:hypothetical protein n=1 Tax=Gallibacterium salpingitidis TaxID=505341 RepID=UPI000805896F|nr:hypothetical protein [Gallibacterium salpingitidis]OBX06659.1 hypothetical protein QV08_09635 [Gallibacterium salpingitidis]